MNKSFMIMYFIEEQAEQEHHPDYPNAFVIQTRRDIKVNNVKDVFPWDKLPLDCPKNMRFALKTGSQVYWLDLKDDQPVPFVSQDSILLKLSDGI